MAYFDETKAQEAKDKGNEFFKKGQFPDAIKAYEEGLKRTADGDCVSYFDYCISEIITFSGYESEAPFQPSWLLLEADGIPSSSERLRRGAQIQA